MLIEVGGLPGGFNIIVATSATLAGPWNLGPAPPTLAPTPPACPTPVGGYCELVHRTPTHVQSGVLKSGSWPVRDITRWTILQNMTLITSDCVAARSLSLKWP